jgi:phage terminase large subunit GpA-like protein
MVYKFPSNEKLWEQYTEVRAESLRRHGDLREATTFYTANRKALDEGAEVAWEARFNHDEVSALQHAMNLKLQDEAAFWSEYQNEPLPSYSGDEEMVSIDDVLKKLSGIKKGEVPAECSYVTMHIDIQKKLLFYVVTAWSDGFSGSVIDYGTYPEQYRRVFTLRDARPSLQDIMPSLSLEAAVYSGLDFLANKLCGNEWRRSDGAIMKIGRCVIDANWGFSTDIVYQFCRQSVHSEILVPGHGRYVGASSLSFAALPKRLGDKRGLNWYMRKGDKRSIRHIAYDANFWKSFVHLRLKVPIGDKGCLTIFGNQPEFHRTFAEHLTAEYFVKTQGRGRTVDEWKLRPEASDNHWLDGLTGCAVGASMLGVTLPEIGEAGFRRKREQICLSELQRQRWAEKAKQGLM